MHQTKATMKNHSKPPGEPVDTSASIILGSWVTSPTLHSMEVPSPVAKQISAVRRQTSCLLIWVNLIMQCSLENTEATEHHFLVPLSLENNRPSPAGGGNKTAPLCLVFNCTCSAIRLSAFKKKMTSTF